MKFWGLLFLLSGGVLFGGAGRVWADELAEPAGAGVLRVATFNCSLNREAAGQLERDLGTDGDVQARKVARVLRRVRPDIVLLNEFDFSEPAVAAEGFLKNYLSSEVSWAEESPLQYAHWWTGPVNTGVPTGRDLDRDGKSNGPGDAFGFGRFPGQYGMLLLSRYPIRVQDVRTFQKASRMGRGMPLVSGDFRGSTGCCCCRGIRSGFRTCERFRNCFGSRCRVPCCRWIRGLSGGGIRTRIWVCFGYRPRATGTFRWR
ncbi:hypothetical protein LBMAG46_37740 [Planctomycetia bacterium]|nr:hypothetical protein LBMAG46_37740 [Planctomycetia bacterium]